MTCHLRASNAVACQTSNTFSYAGVSALYVHIMAVNGAAAKFYELQGFMCEQEESSNQAHYR